MTSLEKRLRMQNDDKLRDEVALAGRARKAYELFIKGFIEQKREDLFEVFCDLQNTDTEGLIEVKRMLSAINALEMDVRNVLDTGKLAQTMLNEEETQ